MPFVEISRQKLRQDIREEMADAGIEMAEEALNAIAEKRLRKEVASGVQTIQYQLVTLMTTNGWFLAVVKSCEPIEYRVCATQRANGRS